MYGSSLETCRDNIIADIKRCFTKTLKSKSYLVKCLENKLKYCFDNFYPHSVFCHLVSCNRKIRAVGKCNLCTRFYVENKSMMILLRSTVTFSSFLRADFDINKIFSEVKKSTAYANVFYKTLYITAQNELSSVKHLGSLSINGLLFMFSILKYFFECTLMS